MKVIYKKWDLSTIAKHNVDCECWEVETMMTYLLLIAYKSYNCPLSIKIRRVKLYTCKSANKNIIGYWLGIFNVYLSKVQLALLKI